LVSLLPFCQKTPAGTPNAHRQAQFQLTEVQRDQQTHYHREKAETFDKSGGNDHGRLNPVGGFGLRAMASTAPPPIRPMPNPTPNATRPAPIPAPITARPTLLETSLAACNNKVSNMIIGIYIKVKQKFR
jgi:hypothetical protein